MALESEFDFFSRFFCPKLGIDEVNRKHLVLNNVPKLCFKKKRILKVILALK